MGKGWPVERLTFADASCFSSSAAREARAAKAMRLRSGVETDARVHVFERQTHRANAEADAHKNGQDGNLKA
ncbi:MAG: hypothetical protein K2P80_14430 [Beijerinckiaceae bacterium]|nr:hypothetical protein [Beijerinckiaceae bacterium]